ncbi:MAG: aminoacyl-tRNA hydrolase, partial [Pseudomonadota bacterium]
MIKSLFQWMAGWLQGHPAILDSGDEGSGELVMHILVGQGNPGSKYQGNRHNLGFMVLDAIAADHGFGPWRSKFQSQVSEGKIGGKKIL